MQSLICANLPWRVEAQNILEYLYQLSVLEFTSVFFSSVLKASTYLSNCDFKFIVYILEEVKMPYIKNVTF